MKHIKPNKQYALIALYVFAVIVLALLCALVAFNLGGIFAWIGRAVTQIRGLMYGIVIALVLYPFVNFSAAKFSKLLNKKKPHPKLVKALSLLSVYAGAFLTLCVLMLGILRPMVSTVTELGSMISGAAVATAEWLDSMFANSPFLLQMYGQAKDFLTHYIPSLATGQLTGILQEIAGSFLGKTFDLIIGLVLSIYLLAGRSTLNVIFGKIVAAVLPKKGAPHFTTFVKRLYSNFTEFVAARIISALLLGITTYLLFWVCGVPFYPLFALIVCVLSLFPVFGSVFSLIISAIIIFITYREYFLLVVGGMILLQIADNLLLEPRLIQHKTLRPDVGTVIVLLLCGYALLGFPGALIAIPVYATVETSVRSLCIRRLLKKNLPVALENYRHFKIEKYAPKTAPAAEGSVADSPVAEAPAPAGEQKKSVNEPADPQQRDENSPESKKS